MTQRIDDAATRTRYLIVLHADRSVPKAQIARALGCCRQTVDRVIDRYNELGEAGLLDRREDNGQRRADKLYVSTLKWILESSPRVFCHRRPTWTHQLLIETAATYTGVRISKRTMGRVLADLKVRRGRPKPLAPCPWPARRRNRVISAVKRLIQNLPPSEVALWEDEADIDLNPRIGLDYMLPGTQRTVMTPWQERQALPRRRHGCHQRPRHVGEWRSEELVVVHRHAQEAVGTVPAREGDPRDLRQLHDPRQPADANVAGRARTTDQAALPSAVLSGRQSDRACDLARDARQRHGEPLLRNDRRADAGGRLVADEPQPPAPKQEGRVNVTESRRVI
jgi:transposase